MKLNCIIGDGKNLVERFTSVIHHVCNRHTFQGWTYDRCEHDPYNSETSKRKSWLNFDSPPHNALRTVVLNKQLQNDLEKLNENIFTTYLEVFHSLKKRYPPKSIFYEKEKNAGWCKIGCA